MLTSAPDPSVFGQPVTFTATVTASTTPAGSVTFYQCTSPPGLGPGSPASACSSAVALSTRAVDGSGQASYQAPALAVGPDVVYAAFTPADPARFTASSSPTLTQVVNQAATTTVLTSAPDPSVFGQPVTVSATVAPANGGGIPDGTVSLYLGTLGGSHSLLGTASLAATGTAEFTTSALAGGSDSLYAIYQGSANYTGSTSAVLTQTVTFTSACITTTVNGALTVEPGQAICITSSGRVNGGVTVQLGGALYLSNATINGGIKATGATALLLCGSAINGGITASGTTGFIMIGDGGDDAPAELPAWHHQRQPHTHQQRRRPGNRREPDHRSHHPDREHRCRTHRRRHHPRSRRQHHHRRVVLRHLQQPGYHRRRPAEHRHRHQNRPMRQRRILTTGETITGHRHTCGVRLIQRPV